MKCFPILGVFSVSCSYRMVIFCARYWIVWLLDRLSGSQAHMGLSGDVIHAFVARSAAHKRKFLVIHLNLDFCGLFSCVESPHGGWLPYCCGMAFVPWCHNSTTLKQTRQVHAAWNGHIWRRLNRNNGCHHRQMKRGKSLFRSLSFYRCVTEIEPFTRWFGCSLFHLAIKLPVHIAQRYRSLFIYECFCSAAIIVISNGHPDVEFCWMFTTRKPHCTPFYHLYQRTCWWTVRQTPCIHRTSFTFRMR